jgi:hypothetical protein
MKKLENVAGWHIAAMEDAALLLRGRPAFWR